MTSYIALAAGVVAVPIFCWIAGRSVGVSAIAVWSAATAYFFMPPQYSFRISHAGDWVAMALFGAIGIVFAKTVPRAKEAIRDQRDAPHRRHAPMAIVNLEALLKDLMSSSELGERLRELRIEVAQRPQLFRCSYVDMRYVLSELLTIATNDPELRHLSFNVCRRPGVSLLFVTGLRTSPPPLKQPVAIGRNPENCETVQSSWPPGVHATWFDNGYARIFQVAIQETTRSSFE